MWTVPAAQEYTCTSHRWALATERVTTSTVTQQKESAMQWCSRLQRNVMQLFAVPLLCGLGVQPWGTIRMLHMSYRCDLHRLGPPLVKHVVLLR